MFAKGLINPFLFVSSSGVTCVVGPPKGSIPKFYIKPVTVYGDAVTGQEGNRLSEEGNSSLLLLLSYTVNLSKKSIICFFFLMDTAIEPFNLEGKFLSIDWRNHPRSQDFVNVDEKQDLVSWNRAIFV